MPTLNNHWYKGDPIASLDSLALALGVTKEAILSARATADESYRRTERAKKDGGIRVTYSVAKPLKAIQNRILHRILRRLNLPDYLLGGRPGKDYLDNVQYHCGAKVLFGEDVSSFYPSIKRFHVKGIFQQLLRFPPEIADCLTDLCIHQGEVPQGAPTSGDLANAVLWKREPKVVQQFLERQLRYTRYVDDIYVSAERPISAREKTWIVSQIHRLLNLEGFRVKRKKHELATSGSSMRVHRVGINAGRPSISQAERAKLRAAVHHLEKDWRSLERSVATKKFQSLNGKVAVLKGLQPTDYAELRARLSSLQSGLPKKISGAP